MRRSLLDSVVLVLHTMAYNHLWLYEYGECGAPYTEKEKLGIINVAFSLEKLSILSQSQGDL